jgi:hypothetical protein
MRFPAINKQGKRRVGIPEFTGGINLRDNPSQCNDNQLTELVNLWFKDGTLRTRPGLVKFGDNNVFEIKPPSLAGQNFIEGKAHNIQNKNRRLITIKEIGTTTTGEDLSEQTFFFAIHFFWCGNEGAEKLPSIIYDYQENDLVYKDLENYFVINQNGTLYCFVKMNLDNAIYKLEKDKAEWIPIARDDLYIPTVMTHCKTSHKLDSGRASEIGHTGTMLEGYNLLSDYYKMVFSTINTNAEVSEDAFEMVYSVETSTYHDKYKGYVVKAEYTDKNGKTHKHSVTLQGAVEGWWVWEEKASTDGYFMGVCSRQIRFRNSNKETIKLNVKEFVEDNLTITIPFIPDEREKEVDKIFSMTNSEWFGGSSAGISGGTRLFLCGNTKEEEKSLVVWSGLNNPLYFPENSYFYVGDTSQKVTGFGKQANMLVIFKENETWYTQYFQNTNITGEDLTSQRVVDLQASAVYFPLVQINSEIGCPYPDTIQLCRNRLVWLGNRDRVYSLVSESQYNERNIYVVSEMIERKFKKDRLFKSIAFDWNGYYCLKCEDEVFLMDYNSNGYVYVSSHSKTEDANIRIPWYYWELSNAEDLETADIMFLCGDELLNMKFKLSGSNITCSSFGFKSREGKDILFDNSTKEIRSLLQTKLFDFGEPNFYKNISTVGLSLGYNGGGEVRVTFITDGGEEQTGLVLEDAAEERSAGWTKSKILTPAICSALRFGIRLESDSDILIDGLTIDYRVTGRAR